MALNGIQIFKLTPKKNCKECGCPTCMAFSMKVAQGAMKIEQCPHMSEDALASLSEATAPPMKTIKIGTGAEEITLGGETVLFRHEKTFVNKSRYAVELCTCMDDATVEAKLAEIPKVDYDRIGERMYTELVYVNCDADADADKYVALVQKAAGLGRTLVLGCTDVEIAKAAVEVCKDSKPVLNGANASNYEAMNAVATAAGYGYEYVVSTMDRIKGAALGQNDNMLQMPIITPVSAETWAVKEATASEADMPEWGSADERGIDMEVMTAAADLAAGSDAVILRHPESIKTISKLIKALA